MTDHDTHVQHTWQLTHPQHGDISIDLWTDGYSVRVDGGDHDDSEGGRTDVDRLLAKYTGRGYQAVRDYAVNDPENTTADEPEDDEPADKPDECPECGSPVEHASNHIADHRQGDAWLCTGCRWGEWIA